MNLPHRTPAIITALMTAVISSTTRVLMATAISTTTGLKEKVGSTTTMDSAVFKAFVLANP